MELHFSSGEEPRLEITTGHFAPMIQPADSALQVTVSALERMFAAWMFGAMRMSQSPAAGLLKFFSFAEAGLMAQS